MWLLYLKKEERTSVSKTFLQHQFGKHKIDAHDLENMGSGYFTSVFIYHFPFIMDV